MITRPVYDGEKREDRLSGTIGRVCGSLVVPSGGLIDSLRQKHRVCDIDILPHFIGGSGRWRVLNTDEIGSEANGDGVGAAN